MENSKLKNIVLEVLKADNRLWDEEEQELNQILLFDLLDKYDETVISLLSNNNETCEKFFLNVKDKYIFKINDFRFFMEENKINNSYTDLVNQIGLSDGQEFIINRSDVVINFPYKDCILEGGQSTEEGIDVYFEYEEEKLKTVKGKKVIEPAGFKEKKTKRNEIFFNEILGQDEIDRLLDEKALVNWTRYNKDGKSDVNGFNRDENGFIRDNLIIKGNNLLALHSLKRQFSKKVKLCYIDVPFNTESDSFVYNDKFNHSTWMTFMKNRLEVTKDLLRNDGLLFVHCDKNEDAYLKVLMDEIFGRNKYITSITVKSNSISGSKTRFKDKTILKNKDTILVYKGSGEVTINPQYTEKSKWDTHYNAYLEIVDEEKNIYKPKRLKDVLVEQGIINSTTTITEDFINNKEFMDFCITNKEQIYRLVNSIPADIKEESLNNENTVIKYKDTEGNTQYALNGSRIAFLSSSVHLIDGEEKLAQLLGDLWTDIDFQNTQNEGGQGVSFPTGKKPEKLLQRIIEMATERGDLVLDFFMGSATTQAVAMKLGRQFIGIEQMDYIENISLKRMNNVINGEQGGISKSIKWQGGGEFIYCELAKWNEQAKEEINKCENLENLKDLFSDLCEKYFLNYNFNVNEFTEKVINKEEFINLSLEEQKSMFITMLDLNQLYIQRTEIEDHKYGVNKKDQQITALFYEGE